MPGVPHPGEHYGNAGFRMQPIPQSDFKVHSGSSSKQLKNAQGSVIGTLGFFGLY
jgi:hypothetical protein